MSSDPQSLNCSNLAFVESIYEAYSRDPASVDPAWQRYFSNFPKNGQVKLGPSFSAGSLFSPPSAATNSSARATSVMTPPSVEAEPADPSSAISNDDLEIRMLKQDRVDQLIRAYRVRGHMIANLSPLAPPRRAHVELDPRFYGFTDEDLDRTYSTYTIHGAQRLTLRQILDRLRNTYCRSIGVQFMHIDDLNIKNWLMERMEGTENRLSLSRREQIRIFTHLSEAIIFEEFVQKKFIGAKSFSLEGSESLIPLIDMAIERASEHGTDQIVIGMAHRGRLNVLANILGKAPREIFREFEDSEPELHRGRGDVKYHMGYSNFYKTSGNKDVHLSLAFNPSHLEFVNPVAMGKLRGKQDRKGDNSRSRKMVMLIHGDAAFCGEGVVQESLNLSELDAYRVGGTLHVICNNLIGFTTTAEQGCSSVYTSDVAKMLQIPIFHVNGEDPEAVAQVVRLAMDFRQTFKRDVVVNMYAYRRRGHNETDEPSFTQPMLYKEIHARKPVREGYLDHLLQMGGMDREMADDITEQIKKQLEEDLAAARSKENIRPAIMPSAWEGYKGAHEDLKDDPDTGVPEAEIVDLLNGLTRLPSGFTPHPKLARWLKTREAMARGEQSLDWSAGEALAFASLVTQGTAIRFTGQDVERGTFSHRHAVLHDYENGTKYMPLANLSPNQARCEIVNSPLSEIAVLGFEYGYSLSCPETLVIWEAQFGDFANCAQVIIDQFIVSGEDKWNHLSGLVLQLPHGFEGQGPEHSSARLERFMTLAADHNIQIVNPTTPAQLFHVLRRQILRKWRKPLITMSPKSLLRHPLCESKLADLTSGTFKRIIPESLLSPEREVDRVLLCSGKIYYELVQRRQEWGKSNVDIIRIEQLYPFPKDQLHDALRRYPKETPVYWVQEEPENMGAWRTIRYHLGDRLFGRWPLYGISRRESASPATGSGAAHKLEQHEILTAALGGGWDAKSTVGHKQVPSGPVPVGPGK
jgi:2-oxoglutarate dehydrogenase E1 component